MFNLLATTPVAPNTFEKIVIFLQRTADRPGNYGWFHLMFVGILIVACVLACVFLRDCSKKTFKWTLFGIWVVLVLFEIYKEVVFAYNYNAETGLGSWRYEWGSFPFQLCSTPFYVLPFAIFLKDGFVKDSALGFLAFFSFFGGLCVYVFPNDVFATSLLGVQLQTMVHHGLQLFVGVFIVAHERKRFNLKFFVKCIPTFAVLLIVALLLNIIGYHLIDGTFNMFYIGPYYPCSLVILSDIYVKVPYIVFFLIYALGFVLAAFIMFGIQFGVVKLCGLLNKACTKKHE